MGRGASSKKEMKAEVRSACARFLRLETDCGPGQLPCTEEEARSWFRLYVGVPQEEERFLSLVRSRGAIRSTP